MFRVRDGLPWKNPGGRDDPAGPGDFDRDAHVGDHGGHCDHCGLGTVDVLSLGRSDDPKRVPPATGVRKFPRVWPRQIACGPRRFALPCSGRIPPLEPRRRRGAVKERARWKLERALAPKLVARQERAPGRPGLLALPEAAFATLLAIRRDAILRLRRAGIHRPREAPVVALCLFAGGVPFEPAPWRPEGAFERPERERRRSVQPASEQGWELQSAPQGAEPPGFRLRRQELP